MAVYAPVYAATPRWSVASISTANTARDGSGTMGTVITAGTSGSRIEQIAIVPAGTTTAGMVRLFLHNGTTATLFKELPIQAVTPSATVPVIPTYMASGSNVELPLILPASASLRASTHNAETFNIHAFGGDF